MGRAYWCTNNKAKIDCGVYDSDKIDKWLEDFITQIHDKFIFAWQEKEPPYLSRADVFSADIIEVGNEKFRYSLSQFKRMYEVFGETRWETGYQETVGSLSLEDLPNKINYI